MGLEFIIGPASCNHEKALVQKAQEWLKKDTRHEVFYLVPNHVKFETEINVLKQLKETNDPVSSSFTATNIQVFSFSRLAWYYLQHTAMYPKNPLSEAGNYMIIRKILQENEAQLTVFRGEIKKRGFIEKLAELFDEWQSGNILVSDLEAVVAQLDHSPKSVDFQLKLQDFECIYAAYLEKMVLESVGSKQLILSLATYLQEQNIGHILFILSGFSSFTATEEVLIQTLIQKAGEVKVGLVLNQGRIDSEPEKTALFYDSKLLYYRLYHQARALGVPVYNDTKLTLQEAQVAQDIKQLDAYWQQSQELSGNNQAHYVATNDTLQIWRAESPYAEISHVAREIRKLVVSGKYRYRDIAVLTRDLEHYRSVFTPVFKAHEIPADLNYEVKMEHHPLIEYLNALFALVQRNFRYTDVMRFLRSELFFPGIESQLSLGEWQKKRQEQREKVDLTENVMLAYGYEGYYWTQEKDWQYVFYDFEEQTTDVERNLKIQEVSNEIRNLLRKNVLPLFDQLKKVADGREAMTCLYQFLLNSGTAQTLLFLRDEEISLGNLEMARNHEQAWKTLMTLFDEYVQVLGDDPFELEPFIEILQAGLEGAKFKKVPVTLDQVSVSALDLVHAEKKKVVFIVGVTDQLLPQKVENKTLLSQEERDLFDRTLPDEKFLQVDTTRTIAREPFIAYLAFTSAQEKLYMSYPTYCDWAKESRISAYLARIAQGLHVKIKDKSFMADGRATSTEFISTKRALMSELIQLKRQEKEEGLSLSVFWQQLERYLMKAEAGKSLLQTIFSSLSYKNTPETLNSDIVTDLYGETIHASVSKIESFYQCEYQYFVNYGLKIKEREIFGLSPAATGEFFHEALDYLFKVLIREGISLANINQEELLRVTDGVLSEILGEQKFSILHASNRMNYIRYQLSKTIQRVSWALQKQSQRTGMTTLQTEVLFGQFATQQGGLDSLSFELTGGKQLKVRGKIDRIDQIKTDEAIYLAVIDYKSSAHKFDFRDAYYGVAMQMITYLDIALSQAVKLVGQAVKPAGAFYLHVKNPVIDGEVSDEKYMEKMLQEFGYQGLLLKDEALVRKLDPTVEPKTKSLVYPFNETAKGEIKSNQFVDEKQMSALLAHNQKNFKKAGEKIYEGELLLNPAYRDKQRIACSFCPFKSVCTFDPMLAENTYHRLDKLKKEDVLKRILDESTEEGDEEE